MHNPSSVFAIFDDERYAFYEHKIVARAGTKGVTFSSSLKWTERCSKLPPFSGRHVMLLQQFARGAMPSQQLAIAPVG